MSYYFDLGTCKSFFDTIVIGGGICGAATADALAQRGQQVLLIDQFEPGHERGSSHGDGRIIRLGYPERVYVEMAQLSYPAWEALGRRAGEVLMRRTGGWECGPADGQWLHELEASFRHFDIAYERFSPAKSNRRFPHYHVDEGSEAIFHAEAGVVFATRAVRALWRQVRAAGGTTLSGERVEEIEVDGEQVVVRTSKARFGAKRVVVATGAWSQRLLAGLGLQLPLEVTQEQVAYFPAKEDATGTPLLDHRLGMMPIGGDYHLSHSFYILPQIDVAGVKVGWHGSGPTIDPDHRQPADDSNLATLQELVRQRLPHLHSTPILRQTCLYTNTPDSNFILDRHPDLPNVIIGTGFSGHGFKFGPVVGQILAALTLDERPPLPLDMFRINRFTVQ